MWHTSKSPSRSTQEHKSVAKCGKIRRWIVLRKRTKLLLAALYLFLLACIQEQQLEWSMRKQETSLRTQETNVELLNCLKAEFPKRYTWPALLSDGDALRIQAMLVARHICVHTEKFDLSNQDLEELLLATTHSVQDDHEEDETVIDQKKPNEMGTLVHRSLHLQERCQQPSTRHLFFSNKPRRVGTGLGSRLHMIAVGLHHATFLPHRHSSFQRVLAMEPGGWAYAPRNCTYQDYRCYFQPWTSCIVTPTRDWGWLEILQDRMGMPRWYDNAAHQMFFRTTMQMPENHAAKLRTNSMQLPLEFRHKGWLWYVSQLLYYTLQPTLDSKSHALGEIRRMEQTFGPEWSGNGNCVVMHVRHGDKIAEAETYGFSDYMTQLRGLKNATGIYRVLAFSDDPDIATFCKNHSGEFRFHLAGGFRVPGIQSAAQRLTEKGRTFDPGTETQPMLNELFAATRCDHFIGTASSGWSRVVLKFMTAVNGKPIRYFSLDNWTLDQTGSGPDEMENN